MGLRKRKKPSTQGEYIVPQKNKDGKPYVTLFKDGKPHEHDVAIMVAQTFIPNPNNYQFVKHKDGNLENCAAHNLYWSETE